jgi:hypothetical protein
MLTIADLLRDAAGLRMPTGAETMFRRRCWHRSWRCESVSSTLRPESPSWTNPNNAATVTQHEP